MNISLRYKKSWIRQLSGIYTSNVNKKHIQSTLDIPPTTKHQNILRSFIFQSFFWNLKDNIDNLWVMREWKVKKKIQRWTSLRKHASGKIIWGTVGFEKKEACKGLVWPNTSDSMIISFHSNDNNGRAAEEMCFIEQLKSTHFIQPAWTQFIPTCSRQKTCPGASARNPTREKRGMKNSVSKKRKTNTTSV